jgi:heptosyltransferase-2
MAEVRAVTQCRFFSGHKPCGKHSDCIESCPSKDIPQTRILIIHLGALGAVARATCLLAAIKRKYPSSSITWVTDAPAQYLLKHNFHLDRVLTTNADDQLILRSLHFDVGFVVDKSLKAAGVLGLTKADKIYGFIVEPRTGAILPATDKANELWELGLSNEKKFFQNKKAETQLMVEALELGPFSRDEYDLPLTADEARMSETRNREWKKTPGQIVVGLNTGCSSIIAAKKWTVEYHRRVIGTLLSLGYKNIVLLGGPEDTLRNQRIGAGLPVVQSPTDFGLRDGLVSVDACDLVVTGDSLGMHLAIARKKYVIAWFGPTCAHEIDLYDRGEILLANVPCAPCWKRSCDKVAMCYDHVALNDVIKAVQKGEKWLFAPISSSKLPFLETFVSASPL